MGREVRIGFAFGGSGGARRGRLQDESTSVTSTTVTGAVSASAQRTRDDVGARARPPFLAIGGGSRVPALFLGNADALGRSNSELRWKKASNRKKKTQECNSSLTIAHLELGGVEIDEALAWQKVTACKLRSGSIVEFFLFFARAQRAQQLSELCD